MEYNLKCGSSAAKILSFGAESVSHVVGGRELMWQKNAKYWPGCAPNLFPIMGGLKNGETIIEGQKYKMHSHGFARNMEFSLKEKTESSVSLSLTETPETLKMYPYKFNFTVTYELAENAMTTRYTVKNTNGRTMLFNVGGHPGYNMPLFPGESFEDYVAEFEKEETLVVPRTPPESIAPYLTNGKTSRFPLRHSLFDEKALMFNPLKSSWVKVTNPKTGKGLRMDVQGFTTMALWHALKSDAPFLCLEPWAGLFDMYGEFEQFSDRVGIVSLNAGEEYIAEYTINVLG